VNKLDLNALFARAAQQGTLSSTNVITGNLGGIVVAGAAGMAAEDIQASDVTLITLCIDASSSIGDRKLAKAVCEGQHMLLDAFAGSKERDAVLVALWTFQSEATVVHGYVPVVDATRLDATTYRTGGCTHLYDTFLDACAANVAYAQTLRDAGTPVRSIVVVITDGEDVGSKRPARACKKLAEDLLKSEQFILAFVGVGGDVDFHKVAKSMGFADGCVLVQKDATPTGLRTAFQMVSQSAIRASQGRIAPGVNAGFFAP
jgi:Mg-chelatase subunit ChlD